MITAIYYSYTEKTKYSLCYNYFGVNQVYYTVTQHKQTKQILFWSVQPERLNHNPL